jgi:alkyl sulfatase BDS1-like metallo-beta-lactamase superfamily hydrolase
VIAGRKKTEKKTQENDKKQENEKKVREHERAGWKRRQEGRWSTEGKTKRVQDADGRVVYRAARYVHHRPRRVEREREPAAVQSGILDTARPDWRLALPCRAAPLD